eukprot:596846-Prymnesium_polylepis.2
MLLCVIAQLEGRIWRSVALGLSASPHFVTDEHGLHRGQAALANRTPTFGQDLGHLERMHHQRIGAVDGIRKPVDNAVMLLVCLVAGALLVQ